MAAKVELLQRSFIRPEPRQVTQLKPNEVWEFINTKEIDYFRVFHTPDIAQVCMKLNRKDNRNISKHKLAQITRDMEHGTNVQFLENGDTIRFDWDGRMFDGQKRNMAIIASDTPQILTWAIGLNPEAHFVTDKGQKRSLGDSLRIDGYSHYTIVAAAGIWLYIIKYCNEPGGFVLKQRLGSDEEVYRLIKRHSGLLKSVSHCHGALPGKRADNVAGSRHQLVPVSLLSVIHYIAKEFLDSGEIADAFVRTVTKFPLEVAYPHAMESGPGLYNPVSIWLKWLDERKKEDIIVTREMKGTGTIQAWNLYSQGKRLEKMKFPKSNHSIINGLNLDLI